MIESIRDIINYLGTGNVLTILVFLIGLFAGFYFYFKTFFRLTYSTGRICKNCNEIKDWTNQEIEFTTRVMFFNNGRKTITRNDIQNLELLSSGRINSIKTIKSNGKIKTIMNSDKVNIDIDYIDSSDFFVLEINHNGQLEVKGRISETGNLLHGEPKSWLLFNIVVVIISIAITLYNITFIIDAKVGDILKVVINCCVILFLFSVTRFIHSILFIPDRVASRYLDTKDKSAKEFLN